MSVADSLLLGPSGIRAQDLDGVDDLSSARGLWHHGATLEKNTLKDPVAKCGDADGRCVVDCVGAKSRCRASGLR